jgi:integrase
MAKPAFRVKAYKHPRLKFVVRSKISGKWERKFFRTKVEAQTYVQLKETELLNHGKEGATFPSWLRVMAARENDRLKSFGKTLTDATDFYLRHLEATSRSVPVAQATRELLQNRKASGLSDRYVYEMDLKLRRFCNDFPDRCIAQISTADVDTWLERLSLAPGSRNTFRRDLNTLFSFAVTRRYCATNPVIESSIAKDIDEEVGILSVNQIIKLLEVASDAMIPFFAIGAFAGLRRAELERMDWLQIDFESGLINVKARHSKTAARRLVTIQPNLAAWLAPYGKHSGSICPPMFRTLFDEEREHAGLLRDWPQNALRHSYGSYHLAKFQDAPALALQMGNSVEVIMKHYRELVKPKEAARYWQIKPSVSASRKVVAFRQY